MATIYNPASPGELLKEFLGDKTATQLAEHIGVARAAISRILHGRTAVTMDLGIRLGEALALSPDFFSKAQLQYDLWVESTAVPQLLCPEAVMLSGFFIKKKRPSKTPEMAKRTVEPL